MSERDQYEVHYRWKAETVSIIASRESAQEIIDWLRTFDRIPTVTLTEPTVPTRGGVKAEPAENTAQARSATPAPPGAVPLPWTEAELAEAIYEDESFTRNVHEMNRTAAAVIAARVALGRGRGHEGP